VGDSVQSACENYIDLAIAVKVACDETDGIAHSGPSRWACPKGTVAIAEENVDAAVGRDQVWDSVTIRIGHFDTRQQNHSCFHHS
jgi:hypothetical protein